MYTPLISTKRLSRVLWGITGWKPKHTWEQRKSSNPDFLDPLAHFYGPAALWQRGSGSSAFTQISRRNFRTRSPRDTRSKIFRHRVAEVAPWPKYQIDNLNLCFWWTRRGKIHSEIGEPDRSFMKYAGTWKYLIIRQFQTNKNLFRFYGYAFQCFKRTHHQSRKRFVTEEILKAMLFNSGSRKRQPSQYFLSNF